MNLLLYTMKLINRIHLTVKNIYIIEILFSVSIILGRAPVKRCEESQLCSSRNTEGCFKIECRFSDWVVCVMCEYHSNQSKQFNRGKYINVNTGLNFVLLNERYFLNIKMFQWCSRYFLRHQTTLIRDRLKRGIIKSWFFFLTVFSNFLLHIIQFYFKRFWGHLSYPIDLN